MPVIHSDKFNSYYFEQLGEDVMPVGIYCSPHPPIEKNGISYPSKITDEQFAAIKECGINVVYGHDELFGTPTEEWALKAMEYYLQKGDMLKRIYTQAKERLIRRRDELAIQNAKIESYNEALRFFEMKKADQFLQVVYLK